MAEKVTVMVLKVVDLQCSCCYKKIKKILCKFPQIRDQVYDEKGNTVTITVVCCDPEKIRDKLCCKGHKVIKSIEIKEPTNHKPSGRPPAKKLSKPDLPKVPPPATKPPMERKRVTFPGPPPPYPILTCCEQCYGGFDRGPCHQVYGVPPPPRPCFDGYYRYRCGRGCGYGFGRDCGHFSRSDYYLSEENPSSCSIM